MAGSSLRFVVEVQADQATGALNAMSAAFNQAGISARSSLLSIGGASKQAANEVMSLGDRMKQFTREQRGEMRVGSFFANELAQILPVSAEVKGALAGVGAAIVGGAGILSAIQLVTTAWAYFAKEAAEAAKQLKKTDDLIQNSRGVWAAYTASLTSATGATKVFATEHARLSAALLAAQADLSAAVTKTADDIAILNGETSAGGLEVLAAMGRIFLSTGSAATTAEQQIRKLTEALEVNRALAEEAKKSEQGPAAEKAIDKIQKENEARAKAAREAALNAAKAADQNVLSILKEQLDYEQAVAEGYALIDKQKAERAKKPMDSGGFEEEGARDPEYWKIKAEDARKAQEEYNREVQRSAALAQQWGAALGDVFGKLLTGKATAAQAIAQILQMTIKEATAYAIAAAIGAAKSQSPIPVIGPVLAISAAGSMLALLMGMIGNMPSAAKGWRDTGSYEGLIYVHKREAVLDQQTATDWRAGRSRGGAGAGMTLNFTTPSPKAFADTLADSGSEVNRELRKMDRARRGGR